MSTPIKPLASLAVSNLRQTKLIFSLLWKLAYECETIQDNEQKNCTWVCVDGIYTHTLLLALSIKLNINYIGKLVMLQPGINAYGYLFLMVSGLSLRLLMFIDERMQI